MKHLFKVLTEADFFATPTSVVMLGLAGKSDANNETSMQFYRGKHIPMAL